MVASRQTSLTELMFGRLAVISIVLTCGLGGESSSAFAAKAITLRFEETVFGYRAESSITFDRAKNEMRWVKNTNLPCEGLGALGAFSRKMTKVDEQAYDYFEQVRNRWSKRDGEAAKMHRPVALLDGSASRWSLDGFDLSNQKAEHQMIRAEFRRLCSVKDATTRWKPIPRAGGAPAAVQVDKKGEAFVLNFLAPGGKAPSAQRFEFKKLSCKTISAAGKQMECIIPEWGVVRFVRN